MKQILKSTTPTLFALALIGGLLSPAAQAKEMVNLGHPPGPQKHFLVYTVAEIDAQFTSLQSEQGNQDQRIADQQTQLTQIQSEVSVLKQNVSTLLAKTQEQDQLLTQQRSAFMDALDQFETQTVTTQTARLIRDQVLRELKKPAGN